MVDHARLVAQYGDVRRQCDERQQVTDEHNCAVAPEPAARLRLARVVEGEDVASRTQLVEHEERRLVGEVRGSAGRWC